MDELLREFLTETGENLDVVDTQSQLVRFEQEPDNIKILENIFRLVHTIKGTCGFIGLPRLEALTHAAETRMADFRTGATVTRDAVSLILATIDRIKALLNAIEQQGTEPQGNDRDLIASLEALAGGASVPGQRRRVAGAEPPASPADEAASSQEPARVVDVKREDAASSPGGAHSNAAAEPAGGGKRTALTRRRPAPSGCT
jgi:two-component system chemotaxis sensor kinase CheA